MLDDLRLAWRHQRLELTMLLGGSLILALVITVLSFSLDAAGEELFACLRAVFPTDPNGLACRQESDLANALLGAATIVGPVASVVPIFAGVFIGAPLVGGEIEHRTASMAWSLNASRRQWLIRRTVPIGIAFVAAAGLLAGANHLLLVTAAQDASIGYGQYGMSGMLMVARGASVLAIGLVVGLIIGRVLPAVLVTGLLVIGLMVGTTVGRDMLMRGEAEWMEMGAETTIDTPWYDSGYRDDATGELITWDEMFRRYPEEMESGEATIPGTTMVALVLPPERLPSFTARETAVLGGVALVSALLALGLIGSRRPL